MGKASRRKRSNGHADTSTAMPAPFVARPFEGLAGETDWVALREILPAATAPLALRPEAVAAATADRPGGPVEGADRAVATTVLPFGRPGVRRPDGQTFVALQSGTTSGDPSRDVAHVLLGALASEAGTLYTAPHAATFTTPRLQDLLDIDASFAVTMHEGFDYWAGPDIPMDAPTRASFERAQASLVPTTKLAAAPSAYWCRVGERTHLRWILPHEENAATDALARLHARGTLAGPGGLGEGTRFLGAFRTCGLLAPVWDLDPGLEADAYEEPLAALAARFAEVLAETGPLQGEERRAKAGLLSRQLTLR